MGSEKTVHLFGGRACREVDMRARVLSSSLNIVLFLILNRVKTFFLHCVIALLAVTLCKKQQILNI